MSVDPRTIERPEPPRIRIVRPEPKSVSSDRVELEKIRRELLTLASRVEKLTEGQEIA